jgi:hypothetical protein
MIQGKKLVSEESLTDIGNRIFGKTLVSTNVRKYVSGCIGDQIERELWWGAVNPTHRVWNVIRFQARDDTREKASV